MSPTEFYIGAVVVAGGFIALVLAACIVAAKADRRMRAWMVERQRFSDPLEAKWSAPSYSKRRAVR